MVATVATWDEATLGAPMHADYRVQVPDLTVRSERMLAEPIYRRVARQRPRLVQATVVMTAAQFTAFETFFQTTLDAGQGWFTATMYGPDGPRAGAGHIESYEPEPVGKGWTHAKVRLVMDWID